VRLLHGLAKICATFDDPNLVSRAGLVPVMALAQRAVCVPRISSTALTSRVALRVAAVAARNLQPTCQKWPRKPDF
jgi:hypothetical protein